MTAPEIESKFIYMKAGDVAIVSLNTVQGVMLIKKANTIMVKKDLAHCVKFGLANELSQIKVTEIYILGFSIDEL